MILWHWRCLQETKRTFYAKSPFVYVANLADQIKGSTSEQVQFYIDFISVPHAT